MFQVWNQINCRSLTPESSGLYGVWRNRTFLGIMAAIVAGQLFIVSLGGRLFSVEPLSVVDWLIIVAATSSVLVFAEIVRQLRRGMGQASTG
jgi:Ca2+-transporting ATPase